MSSLESPLCFLLLAGRPENVTSLKELVIFLKNLLWLLRLQITNWEEGKLYTGSHKSSTC